MKQLERNSIHKDSKSHDFLLLEIKDKKVKITYEAYNAVERCNTEVWDGSKWNHALSMMDLGVEPNSSYYVKNESNRKERANDLFEMSKKLIQKII